MKNKSVIKYSILILALILSSLRIHPCLNILSIYLTCLFISINLNAKKMFEYSIFIFGVSIILKVVLNVNSHYFKEDFYENLENEKVDVEVTKTDKDSDKTHNVDDVVGKEDDVEKNEEKDEEDDKEDVTVKEANKSTSLYKSESTNKENSKSTNDLSENEKNMLDFTEALDKVDDDEGFKGTDLNLITPAQAQRELYRLVDTTSLLTKTMNELSPILNEGKNIMNTLEQLNITSKLAK